MKSLTHKMVTTYSKVMVDSSSDNTSITHKTKNNREPNVARKKTSTRAVTLQDIANRCGVVKSTVSLALRYDPRVAPETIERIHTIAREMGYDPFVYESARRLANMRTGQEVVNQIIALFFPPRIYNIKQGGFFSWIFDGIMDGLMAKGFGVLTFDSSQFMDSPLDSAIWMPFARGFVDGAIFSHGIGWREDILQRLRNQAGFANRPAVSMINSMSTTSLVMVNEEDGAYQAARHLITLGHRHILYCTYDKNLGESMQHRVNGFQRALAEAGLDYTRHLHSYTLPICPSWLNPYNVPHQIASLQSEVNADRTDRDFADYMQAHPEITAVIGTNDGNALHVWKALHLAGLRVPDDVSVIGFDDTDGMFDEHGKNLLTSVRLPLHTIGKSAAELIVQQIMDRTDKTEQVTLPVELMARESTAAVRS